MEDEVTAFKCAGEFCRINKEKFIFQCFLQREKTTKL